MERVSLPLFTEFLGNVKSHCLVIYSAVAQSAEQVAVHEGAKRPSAEFEYKLGYRAPGVMEKGGAHWPRGKSENTVTGVRI